MTSETVRRKRRGKQREKNQPAAARNLMPPFPGQRVYGTDPRRQGCVAEEIVQKREDFFRHRDAPLTAPVPFRKTRCTSGERGRKQRHRSRLAPALMLAKLRPVRYGGSAPATLLGKNMKLSLDTPGPSHGRQDWDNLVRLGLSSRAVFNAGRARLNSLSSEEREECLEKSEEFFR
jgi:hypothetical protein